jgi:16S rRNA (cytosine1402-N4)-methyltransferase
MVRGFRDMADDGNGVDDAIGGPVRHIPVMLEEVLAHLEPAEHRIILDGTFGAGGYTGAILARGADVIALDRDPSAIAAGQDMVGRIGGRLALHQSNFGMLDRFAPEGGLDGVVLDIGVSSMQIDEAERGFSFQKNGPLDMRMAAAGVSAADVINRAKVNDLIRIFSLLGEERQASRIAHAIDKRRLQTPFTTTRDLAGLIEVVTPRKMADKIHPATRVFQALRVFVNNELGELVAALFAAERALKPGGRLVVVTFHSLEDRIVKRFFADRSGKATGSRHLPEVRQPPEIFKSMGKQPVLAGEAEAETNPRARSAKLRAGIRTDARPGKPDMSIFDLPQLTDIEKLKG